jgi:hypothetical protein
MASLILRTTASGVVHGLVNRVANSIQTDGFEHMKPDMKAKCIKEKAENAKIVKARYVNKDPGSILEMPYTLGGGEPIDSWVFLDQEVYDVPKGLVKQVNGTQWVQRNKDDSTEEVGKGTSSFKDSGEKIIGRIRQHQFFPVAMDW